jgi:hypothetical protein
MSEEVRCICSSDCPHHANLGRCNNRAANPLPSWFMKDPLGSLEEGRKLEICEDCLAYQKRKTQGTTKPSTQN